ncbi:MAG: EutN/CcmL family microcompartment protein [Candidatus Aureabacteria bacterium]|nr:EutN/CcmL family microcompartment protein [Candidatus Auribacterota bacterium]
MLLGKVMGTLVSTQKDEKLRGLKFLVVEKLDMKGAPAGTFVIAVDSVGAGTGEVVVYVAGSSARYTAATEGKPADATIIGIVDSWDLNGALQYRKSSS